MRFIPKSLTEWIGGILNGKKQKNQEIQENNFENGPCVVDIFDLMGADDFVAVRNQYITTCDYFLLLYSITDASTFTELEKIRNSVLTLKGVTTVPMILVGTKSELEDDRQVPFEKGAALAKEWNVLFSEISSRKSPQKDIEEVVYKLLRIVPRQRNNLYTVVVLGKSGVGKTLFTIKFISQLYSEWRDAPLEDSYRKMIPFNIICPRWERGERWIWVAHVKENKSYCHLAGLPKELIQEIASYL